VTASVVTRKEHVMSKIDEAGEELKQGAGTAAEATKDAANTAGQKIKNRG
jgi:hypothetical protein